MVADDPKVAVEEPQNDGGGGGLGCGGYQEVDRRPEMVPVRPRRELALYVNRPARRRPRELDPVERLEQGPEQRLVLRCGSRAVKYLEYDRRRRRHLVTLEPLSALRGNIRASAAVRPPPDGRISKVASQPR